MRVLLVKWGHFSWPSQPQIHVWGLRLQVGFRVGSEGLVIHYADPHTKKVLTEIQVPGCLFLPVCDIVGMCLTGVFDFCLSGKWGASWKTRPSRTSCKFYLSCLFWECKAFLLLKVFIIADILMNYKVFSPSSSLSSSSLSNHNISNKYKHPWWQN